MTVVTKSIRLTTKGDTDIVDITAGVERCVAESGVSAGIATVFVPGSTAGVTTIEYESGAVRDLKEAWGRIAPEDMHYYHNARWGDGNGHSHVRAAMLGASLTVPFASSELLLGTWQQIVLADFDNRPRSREIIVQIIGE